MISSKQGIEIEGYVQELSNYDKMDIFVNNEACGKFREDVNEAFYFDDGKPEFPSNPYVGLRPLVAHITDVIARALDLCEEQEWIFSLIGCHPYQDSFASVHVHNTLGKSPTKKEEQDMRKRLFSVQPFIELLSMNSPIMNGNIAPVKDVRMSYSTWSQFTDFDVKSTGHYMSLASGRKALTLEVRIPSSCGLYQLIGVTAFIKTILSFDDIPILPIPYVEDLFYKTIRFGGEAICPLILPNKIGYLGLKGKTVYVKISDLFKQFLEDKETRGRLDKVLSELPASTSSNVMAFYKVIANGHTMSDYILHFFDKVRGNRKEVIDLLSQISSSFHGKIPIFSTLETPKNNMLPKLNTTLSIAELEKMLKEEDFYNIQEEIGIEREEIDHVLYTNKFSLRKYKPVKDTIIALLNTKSVSRGILTSGARNFLVNSGVAKYDETSRNLIQGDKFSYVAQIAKDENLI